ncbi:MAG: RecQ family ATP-dependent DNA helicase [Marinilabiliales bacterium]|nr:MAG: RecQ family ATP-dependent DNA helicase [Marinilabiliales bacterium]
MQPEIIESVASGRDTLALMPTGGGKSVTFQVPALAADGICIVVTPLIALMRDQVDNLVKRGIKAQAVYSGMSRAEIDIALDNCAYGDYKFLYVSPERIGSELFRERVKKMRVNILAVDEAHCISQWGYDFRPAYLKISALRELLPGVPVLALTATATAGVVEDIQEKLSFSSPNVIRTSFERENLHYLVEVTEDKHRKLLDFISRIPGSGIVYARNRRKTSELARFLSNNKVKADYYHAGLASATRTARQNDWMEGRTRVIVATNAFGMGIDKADVRFVIHFDIPDTLEACFQEAGRAGRDGKVAFAIMMYNDSDRLNADKRVALKFPEREIIRQVYQSLGSYFQIPYGGGKGAVLDFNISDFASRYNLNVMTAWYSLKELETEGYIELTDEINSPSKIHFIVSRDELYRFQVANAAFDGFIKLLLRTYSGVFSGFAAINEDFLAKKTRSDRDTVYQYLVRLNNLNIIKYIPQRRSPLIIMNTERLDSNSLYMSAKAYRERRESYLARLRSVISYASGKGQCRSVMLLEYFGEKGARKCGNCDICREPDDTGIDRVEFDLIAAGIREVIRHGSVTTGELPSMVDFTPEKTITVTRWLLDNGKLTSGDDGFLSWTG